MDTEGKLEKPIEDALKKLKIDPPSKASSMNMSGPKGASQSDSTSCISSADATSSIKESEVDQEALMGDQNMYYGYYYPGSNFHGEWDNQCCNHGMENLQIEHPVIQTDNGSVVYYFPGIQTGYTTYSPFLPGAIYGVDGQVLGQGSYYPSAASPQTVVSPGLFPQPIAYGPDLVPAYPWDPTFFFPEEIQASTFAVDQTNPHNKQNQPSHGRNHAPFRTSTTSKGSPIASEPTIVQNQTHKPAKKATSSVLSKGYGQINKFNSYANQGKGALLYPNSAIGTKENGRSWVEDESLKPRNKLNSLGDLNLLNEQNRGPRTNGNKTTYQAGVDNSETLSAEKIDNGSGSVAINRDDYNHPDFPLKYEHALFFVIKSYSEDDIHKSIKYNVWASTPNGNKRLDNAFQVAQERMTQKGIKCPVFLFFSVNASGQFCGLAEMTGRVDYSRNMDFWQQDKWNGFFPVKWHIIKDVPNPQFRHIILENNENKPVTNSRDTQEVKFPQGTEMLSIFMNYSSKTSILDDFTFYENRQKAMQEKRNKSTISSDHPVLRNAEQGEGEGHKPGDPKSKSPNLVPVEVKEALSTGIAARK